MEQTLNQVKVTTKELAKQVVIALSFALAYFLLVRLNPFATLTGVASLSALATIRFANVLYAFVLVSPAAAVGISIGGYAFNVYSGKIMFGSYPITAFVILGISLATYYIVHKIGRGTKKDLIVLALYGTAVGTVVALNNVILAAATEGTILGTLFTFGAFYKIANHVVMFLAGYAFVRKFGGVLNAESRSIK